jgi:hypothetical protein
MKRIVSITCLLLAVLLLVGCSGGVSVGGFSSKYMNSDDYEAAVQEVMTYFSSFEGCTLKKIGYAGDAAVKTEAETRGLAPEEVIVLTSTFETDGENHNNGLNPNYTYKDYTWTLTRHTSAGLWEVTDHGYG